MLRQEKNNHKTNAPSAWNFFLIGWLFFSDFLAGIKCYPEKKTDELQSQRDCGYLNASPDLVLRSVVCTLVSTKPPSHCCLAYIATWASRRAKCDILHCLKGPSLGPC